MVALTKSNANVKSKILIHQSGIRMILLDSPLCQIYSKSQVTNVSLTRTHIQGPLLSLYLINNSTFIFKQTILVCYIVFLVIIFPTFFLTHSFTRCMFTASNAQKTIETTNTLGSSLLFPFYFSFLLNKIK